jgi:cytochrome oxidase Cu insertion factor (SCO1/SenC/PrrC family)
MRGRLILGLALAGVLAVAAGAAPAAGGAELGQPAPDFALRDSRGNQVRFSDFSGRVVLLQFLATW